MKNNIKRTLFKTIIIPVIFLLAIDYILRKIFGRKKKIKMGLLDIEFFHKAVGSFGGYGKTAKNITDFYNLNGNHLKIEVIITRSFTKPDIKYLHNTNVLIAPDSDKSKMMNVIKYSMIIAKRNFDFLLTIEYCEDYQYSLFFLPKTPLVIWIHDPRSMDCLEKIATVPLEILAAGKKTAEQLKVHDENIKKSIGKIIKISRLFKRKIIFATTSYFLIERAKRLYNLADIKPFVLPIPVEMPKLDKISYSQKPSVCFLARLDPQKRPWIFFELAKRFKDVDFYVAGNTNYPKIMQPIINRYANISNLRFLGLIDEKRKDELLKNTWGLVNTSIHEGLPVSFIESFAYGKPIISCQNPDGLVERFGEYTGEILGDGYDEKTIDIFAKSLDKFLREDSERIDRGTEARKFVEENYSYQKFDQVIQEIIKEFNI